MGTFAEIREASRYADGRWDVLAVGTARFLVREVHTELGPYLVADVEPVSRRARPMPTRRARGAGRPGDAPVRGLPAAAPAARRRDGEPIDVQMEVETEDRGRMTTTTTPTEAGDRRSARRSLPSSTPRPLPVDDPDAVRVALRIPDDPSALSFLLTGIVQVEPDRRQALLEAASAEERLRDIDALLDRELRLLGARLAPFAVDRRGLAGSSN